MRCQWIVRRAMQPDPDGRRRWDRAYQEALAWTKGLAVASRRGQRHGNPQLRRIQTDVDLAILPHGSSPMR